MDERTRVGRTAILALGAVLLAASACGSDSDSDSAASTGTSIPDGGTESAAAENTDGPTVITVEGYPNIEVRLPAGLFDHPSVDADAEQCATNNFVQRAIAVEQLLDVDLDSLTRDAYACLPLEGLVAYAVSEAEDPSDEQVTCIQAAATAMGVDELAERLTFDATTTLYEPCGTTG